MSAYSGQTAGGGSRQHNGNNYNTNNYFANTRRYNNEGRNHEKDNIDVKKAAGEGQLQRVRYLLERGADIDFASGDLLEPPLVEAIKQDRIEIVEELLHAGADVNWMGLNNDRVLHGAVFVAKKNTAAIVEALILSGSNMEAKGQFNETPLHRVKSAEVANALVQAGADLESRSEFGRTPLHTVAHLGRDAEILDALIRAGAEVNARDETGRTPLGLCLATYFGVISLIDLLKARGGTT